MIITSQVKNNKSIVHDDNRVMEGVVVLKEKNNSDLGDRSGSSKDLPTPPSPDCGQAGPSWG